MIQGKTFPAQGALPRLSAKSPLDLEGWSPPVADIGWIKRKYLDIPYGMESKNQCFDLYLPQEGDGPFPLLIHIHGGGFAMGDKRDDHMNAYLSLLHYGFAVASVEYRFSSEAVFPGAVLDCREAVRYLRANAGEFKVDPDHFGVVGGSAGGNLAAMLAMNVPNGAFPGEKGAECYWQDPYVSVAVDMFGPISFKEMDDQARSNGISNVDHDEPFSPESLYLGMPLPDAPQALCDQADPTSYASLNMCPLLVQHGTADTMVPYEQSENFVRQLEKKGLAPFVTFLAIPEAEHEDKAFFTDINMTLVRNFLQKHI